MTKDRDGSKEETVAENSNLISLDQFRERSRSKMARTITVTQKDPAQAIYDELLKLAEYTQGVRIAHEALLDIALMQSRFIGKVSSDREVKEYLIALQPLMDSYTQKITDLESLE